MPQPKKGPRLGSNAKHQRLMMANLAVSLFEHERVTTTEAKAKALRPFAEKLITKAKTGSVHSRRNVLSQIEDREVVHKLFAEIAPRFSERNGGYTRILKLGPRNGDGAPMALIELVEGGIVATTDEDDEGTSASRRGLRRPARKKDDAEATAAETSEDAADSEDIEDAAEADEVATTAEEDSPATDAEAAEDTSEASGDEDTETPGDATAESAQDQPGDGDAEAGETETEKDS